MVAFVLAYIRKSRVVDAAKIRAYNPINKQRGQGGGRAQEGLMMREVFLVFGGSWSPVSGDAAAAQREVRS